MADPLDMGELRQAANEQAARLRLIASDLRSAADVALVSLDERGVGPANITLADELWLVALALDGRLSNDEEPPAARQQVVVTAEMVEAAARDADDNDPSLYGDGKWSERMAEALTARLNREAR